MIIARPEVCILYGRICDITESGDVTTIRLDAGVLIDLQFSTKYIQKMKPHVGGKCCCTAFEQPEFFIYSDGGIFKTQKPITAKGVSMIYSGTVFVKGKKLFKNLELVYGMVIRSEFKDHYNEYLVTYRAGKSNTTKVIKEGLNGRTKVQEGQKYLFVQETNKEEGGPFWASGII